MTLIAYYCSVHGKVVETLPDAVVTCSCGRKAKPLKTVLSSSSSK